MGRSRWAVVLAIIIVLAAVAAAYAAGQAKAPKVVRAQRFEVVDGQGRVCAVLGATSTGSGLFLWNEKGMMCAGLVVTTHGGPGLLLVDENGKATWSRP